jgi:hypothetical protein
MLLTYLRESSIQRFSWFDCAALPAIRAGHNIRALVNSPDRCGVAFAYRASAVGFGPDGVDSAHDVADIKRLSHCNAICLHWFARLWISWAMNESRIRLTQKETYYPFFKTVGRSIAVFYTYTIHDDGSELIDSPMNGRTYSSRSDFIAAMRSIVVSRFGRLPAWSKELRGECDEATSSAFRGETRACVGF